MTPDTVAVIALTAIVSGCYAVVAIARIVFGRRHAEPQLPQVAQLEERVARLEHAVESLSVDSSRLVDGQRFLTQLLADRQAAGELVPRIKS